MQRAIRRQIIRESANDYRRGHHYNRKPVPAQNRAANRFAMLMAIRNATKNFTAAMRRKETKPTARSTVDA